METEFTPGLERVAASIAETNLRRKALEDELAAASAAVASVQQQSGALEQAMSELRTQLEAALAAQAHDDRTFEQLAGERSKAAERCDALRTGIEFSLREHEVAQGALRDQIQGARRAIASVEAEVRGVKTAFAAVASESAGVQEALACVRESSDAAQAALADINSKTRDLDAATDGLAARVCRIAESVDHVERSEQHMHSMTDGLAKLATMLETRKLEAETAADAVAALTRDRKASAARIAEKLAELDRLRAVGGFTKNDADQAAVTPPASRDPVRGDGSSNARYPVTLATLQLLGQEGLLGPADVASATALVREGGADKLVRAWWTRAMGGPAPAYYRLIVGVALSEADDQKGALTLFSRAVESKPADPFVAYLVARALLGCKRYVDVLRIAASLGRNKHGKPLALNVEALHAMSARRFEEAEAKLIEALAIPKIARLYYKETLYNLAGLAEAKGEAAAASAWYDKLRDLDPAYRGIANHIESNPVAAEAR